MTARKSTPLAERRREAKERRERLATSKQVADLTVSEDIDPSDLLKSTKKIIHMEIQAMAKRQGAGEALSASEAQKLLRMIGTIGQLIAIADKTKPDLSGMSDEELAALAGAEPVKGPGRP